MSYQPHAHAQRLASRRTNSISAIIPYFTNYFFLQVLQGVQDRASELGFDLIPLRREQPVRRRVLSPAIPPAGRVDGVLFFSMKFPESYASKFPQMNLPLVLVDTFHPPSTPCGSRTAREPGWRPSTLSAWGTAALPC